MIIYLKKGSQEPFNFDGQPYSYLDNNRRARLNLDSLGINKLQYKEFSRNGPDYLKLVRWAAIQGLRVIKGASKNVR